MTSIPHQHLTDAAQKRVDAEQPQMVEGFQAFTVPPYVPSDAVREQSRLLSEAQRRSNEATFPAYVHF